MKVFIQRKPRGLDVPWRTVERINKGNRGCRLAMDRADELRRQDKDHVYRVRFDHYLFPAKRNNPFVKPEERLAIVEFCRQKAKTPLDKHRRPATREP